MKLFIAIFIKVIKRLVQTAIYKWEYLYYRFFYSRPKLEIDFTQKRYIIGGGEKLKIIDADYRKLFSDNVQTKIAEADLICRHIFNLLGSGPKKLSPEGIGYQPIDWHSDFKSGYCWNPKTFYRNIRYGHTEGVDIKVPWELSRFQHLNILGQAYILTKDKKYSVEFANQIIDWIRNNPVGFGVNWKCTMDVAIRITNWLVGMEYFSGREIFSKDFLEEFYVSIYEHAKFIHSHLEYSSVLTSNHYLSDIAGLFFIAIYCPFFRESKYWLSFCKRQLENEMQKQVYDDGCNFEASIFYHRLVLEMFFYCELLGRRAGIEFSAKYRTKLKKMFEFFLYYIKPDGTAPQIGDNDSGRFLIFSRIPVLEHKYLSNLATIYYETPHFKLPQLNFGEEAFWVFGREGKKIYESLSYREKLLSPKVFPDAGCYIIRHNNHYCFISCGLNSQNGKGGHAHNDKLSFELVIEGQDIIIDPGTYVYTAHPEERNKFRSTEYHNTIKFNNCEQNEISKRNIFDLPDRVKIKNPVLEDTENEIKFEGEIQYLDFMHKRIIILNKKTCNWQITDNIFCPKSIKAKLRFHLSPDIYYDNGYISSKNTDKKIASIEIESREIKKEEYDYSPEYGVKMKSECLAVDIPAVEGNSTIVTYIRRIE